MKGTITRFMSERHFGFLIADDGQELFFHELDATLLPKPFARGQKVEFEIGVFKSRTKATNLRPVHARAERVQDEQAN
jgi:cold shock CspA family protein